MRLTAAAAIAVLSLSACVNWIPLPKTVGERDSGFSYIPLDPLPVYVSPHPISCRVADDGSGAFAPGFEAKPLLDSLPDNAVRIAVKEYNGKGKLSFSGSSVGVEGNRYQVILDYINVDTSNMRFYIDQHRDENGIAKSVPEVVRVTPYAEFAAIGPNDKRTPEQLARARGNTVIPVYVGVGLRLTADLQVLKGTVNLSSLGAIAAGVESGRASGSLVVQTLGITGKQVSTALPLPSELNQTTVQNAILSLGSIKAIIFDSANTNTTPRVTGMYLPIRNASEDLVNSIVSELAREPIPWPHPCIYKAPKSVAEASTVSSATNRGASPTTAVAPPTRLSSAVPASAPAPVRLKPAR